MALRRNAQPVELPALALPPLVAKEVEGWRNQGYYPFPSDTTRELLRHWFDRCEEARDRFRVRLRTSRESVSCLDGAPSIGSPRRHADLSISAQVVKRAS